MIGKIPKAGRGFKGIIGYLLDGRRTPEQGNTPTDERANAPTEERTNGRKDRVLWAETHNLLTRDPRQAVRIMRATANKSRRCKSPVYHFVISWTPEERPSEDLKRRIVADTCTDMGLADHQRIVIAHDDTRHAHVHIVVNRVHPDTGKAWNRQQDWVRLEQSLARQAKQHGLLFVPGRHNTDQLKDQPRRVRDPEYQQSRRNGAPPPVAWTDTRIAAERARIVALFDGATSWDQLAATLADQGLRLERKGQGHVLRDQSGEVKLSRISRTIRIGILENRFKSAWHPANTTPAAHYPSAAQKPPRANDRKPPPIATKTPDRNQIPRHPQVIAPHSSRAPPQQVDRPYGVNQNTPAETPRPVSTPPAPTGRRKRNKGPRM